jgi:hypothetical protein
MRPDLFVLGLLPLTGGIVYVFCTKWIKETNLRVLERYAPRVWTIEREPLWVIRVVGVILMLIGISILDTAVKSH